MASLIRLTVEIAPLQCTLPARWLSTPIWVMDHGVPAGEIVLELVQVREDEIETIVEESSSIAGLGWSICRAERIDGTLGFRRMCAGRKC